MTHRSRPFTVALLVIVFCAGPVGAEEPDKKTDAPEKYTNTLRWSTASEVNNFGFDVYRSRTKDGKYKRVTKKPIAGAGTIDTPTRYSWVDEDIDPTMEYWYFVESISMEGTREPFTPKILAAAKIRPEPEPQP